MTVLFANRHNLLFSISFSVVEFWFLATQEILNFIAFCWDILYIVSANSWSFALLLLFFVIKEVTKLLFF